MSLFWIGAATLVVLMLGFLLLPILKTRRGQHNSSLNTAIAKQQLQEVEREASENLISTKERNDIEREIKLALAQELEDNAGVAGSKVLLSLPMLVVFVLLSLVTIGIYLSVGAYSQLQHWQEAKTTLPTLGQRIVVDADPSVTADELKTFALALRSKLQAEPNDAVGWLLLGRVLSAINDINGSIAAFEKSYQIDPDRNGLLISYSQVLLLTDTESNIHLAKSLLQRAELERNSLGLLAIATTRLGQKEEALGYWQQLQNFVPPSDPIYNNIQQRIAELQGSETRQGRGTSLAVQVTVAEVLRGKIPNRGFLFVFLQNAESTMKMPAAVVKMPLDELTLSGQGLQVTLDKSKAMMPGFSIEDINKGRLIARISLDEKVDVGPGELQGEMQVDLQKGKQLSYVLTIDKELL
ncbi:MAG: c-type cytochrome biogenesis protein CcmI [Aestuariibacter sp.]